FQSASRRSRRQDVTDVGGDMLDLASAWLDAAAHVPFVGAIATTGKLAAKLTDAYLERRRVRGLRDWFANAGLLPAEDVRHDPKSLQGRLYGTDPTVLERLIAPAFAADLADWANERAGTHPKQRSRLVLVLDSYERLAPHQGSSPSATFPFQLVSALHSQNVPALIVIASQNPLRWHFPNALVQEHQLHGFLEAETREYLYSRHVTDEDLMERIYLLTRGCPGLIAALLDVTQHENDAALWDRMEEVIQELDGLDPATHEGRGLFMNWYVDRLERQMAAEHAHLFGFVVAGSALRSFDVRLMRDVVPVPQGTQAALIKLSAYSFLQELANSASAQLPSKRVSFGERWFRIHDLVRQAVQLSETYTAEVTETHQRALAHYDKVTQSDAHQRRALTADVVYHRTCLDAEAGLQEAEDQFRHSIDAHDIAMCDYLVEALMDVPIVDPIAHARVLVLDGRRQRVRAMYGEAIDCFIQAKTESLRAGGISRLNVDITRNLAECHRLHGEPQRAYQEWDELWQIGEQTGDSGVRFFAVEGRLRSHIDHDEMDLAIRYAAQADRLLKTLEVCGSPLFPELDRGRLLIRRAHLNRQLARTYRFTGDYVRAWAFATEAVELYSRQGDEHGLAWALLGLGHVRRGLGELSQAKAHARSAMKVFKPETRPDYHPDPQGISKAIQLLLLTMLAEDEPDESIGEPGPGPKAGRTPAAADLDPGQPDEFAWFARELLRVNEFAVIDPYAPIYASFVLAERSRHIGRRQEAEDWYEETIKACEKIDGRVEAAYARLGQADLWRCSTAADRREDALMAARLAFLDGQATGYAWINFHAALEMTLLGAPEGTSYWLDQAERAVDKIIYPDGPHQKKELLAIVHQVLATAQPLRLIALNVP
ncbi:MAG: tetratricopeptide repeat protein, partial [Acetobacteraceae bacterium]